MDPSSLESETFPKKQTLSNKYHFKTVSWIGVTVSHINNAWCFPE